MTTDLPDGCISRRPTLDDAEAIFAFVTAYNTPIIGFADVTLEDVQDELEEPGFDPATDGWLVDDPGGTVVGYGWAFRNGASDLIDIDAISTYGAVADWLWAQALARAGELGATLGHDEIKVDVGIYQADQARQARAKAHGFTPATTFQRMRIDFDEAPPEPEVPDGVVVETGPGDEAFRRQAHNVSKRAWVDHFGFVEKSFEEWHESIEASSSHDWAQLRVAYLGGKPVAMLRGTNQFVADEDRGYVMTVAVLPEARGRGLAKLLLRQAFADDFRRGRRGTNLHVDSNNVTPALDLYLSVGMQPVLAIDVWRRTLATSPAGHLSPA